MQQVVLAAVELLALHKVHKCVVGAAHLAHNEDPAGLDIGRCDGLHQLVVVER